MKQNILDLSKVLIQDFHYDYIKIKYGDQVEVFLADTNSLMHKLRLKMFMKNSTKIISYLPLSIIKKNLKYYIGVNNLVVYIAKHGTCNRAIKGFVGLKFKICILTTEDNHESKKSKAIKKNVVNDELKYEDYKNVLFNRSYTRHEMNRIQSKDHDPVILAVTASVHFDYKSTFLSAVYPLFRIFGSVSS